MVVDMTRVSERKKFCSKFVSGWNMRTYEQVDVLHSPASKVRTPNILRISPLLQLHFKMHLYCRYKNIYCETEANTQVRTNKAELFT